MSSHQLSPLAPTFGCLLEPNEDRLIPEPARALSALAESGAVLLRGFPFNVDSFVEFSDRCCSSFSKYVGGGIRFRALDRANLGAGGTLMSTTGTTQSFGIPLHGEMYYQKNRPDMLWFYCERAPAQRGQTTLADGAEIFSRLSENSKQLLRSKRLRYVRELEPEDWATSFQTSDVDELRRICQENDMTLELRPNGSVLIDFLSSALVTGPDGAEIFINNAILLWEFERGLRSGAAARVFGSEGLTKLPIVVRLEDGSELPEWLMNDIEAVAEPLTVNINWQNHDVVMVDNRRVLHGRRKSVGDDREIMVRLGNLAHTAAA